MVSRLLVTNICEVVIPEELLETRRRLQVLESLAHTYILALPRLCCLEFAITVKAFEAGVEPDRANPFVPRWHQTYWHPGQPDYQNLLVNYSFVDQVMPLAIHNPNVCRNLPGHAAYLQDAVDKDRTVTDAVRRGSLRFEGGVKRVLRECRIKHPGQSIEEFARWLRDEPIRCPGWRMFNEAFLSFSTNVQDVAKQGDTSDWSHIACLPYVEAITLDRRMVEYGRSASSALRQYNGTIDYSDRIYPDARRWLDVIE